MVLGKVNFPDISVPKKSAMTRNITRIKLFRNYI